MRINLGNLNIIFFLVILSFLIAFKAEMVGSDASIYARKFIKANFIEISEYIESIIKFNFFELAFDIFLKLISLLNSSKYFFFFCVAFTITYLQFLSYKKSKVGKNIFHDLFFISTLLFSSWYITEVTNGIKQGLSLSILYFAIFNYLKNLNYLRFIIFSCISISFHLPQIIILPFLLLVNFRLKFVYLIWFILLIFYIIGFNELIIKKLSYFFDLKIYKEIKFYGYKTNGVGFDRWVGLQWDFLIYTAFFAILPIILRLTKLIKLKRNMNLIFVIKIYLILCMAYFVFGFGPYSNRFAIMCWFLIPIFQSSLFANIKFTNNSLLLISLSFISFAILYFIFKRLEYLTV